MEAQRVEWDVRQVGAETGTRAAGSLVACCRCGLVEMFLDDARVLQQLTGAIEIQVPGEEPEDDGRDGGRRARAVGGTGSGSESESPAGGGWQVVLLDAGPQPIGVIAELRKELPISFVNARAALKQLPWVLTRTSNRRMAEEICERISAMGATARVEPSAI